LQKILVIISLNYGTVFYTDQLKILNYIKIKKIKTWRPGQNACRLLNNGQTIAAESIFTSTYLKAEIQVQVSNFKYIEKIDILLSFEEFRLQVNYIYRVHTLPQIFTKDRDKDNAWQRHKLLEIYTSTPHLQITDKPERSCMENKIRQPNININ